jgi:hypothetical protein
MSISSNFHINYISCFSLQKLRLDFVSFVITGPSTRSATAALIFNGEQAAAGVLASDATQCVTDQV